MQITSFTYFRINYPTNGEIRLKNAGDSLQLQLDPSNTAELSASHLGEERYVLEAVYFHWGTEPMNGSEHTIGGVGYAGEIQFIHRNTKFSNMEAAFKEADGILGVAVLLNVSLYNCLKENFVCNMNNTV